MIGWGIRPIRTLRAGACRKAQQSDHAEETEGPHRVTSSNPHHSHTTLLDLPLLHTPLPSPRWPTRPWTNRPRQEPFEHRLLNIPKLIFLEGTLVKTFAQLKEKLIASASDARVLTAALVRQCRSRRSRH